MTISRALILVVCAVFLALRIALLACSSDIYFFPDEHFMGMTAKGALGGSVAPLFDYHYHPHEGGTLVFGLTAAPFFALFGDSYFSLKLAALAWAFGAFLLWVTYARRCSGDVAAVLTALFVCFAPPNLIRLSLWAIGTQPQCPLADIGVIAACCLLIGSPSLPAPGAAGRRAAAAMLFGFACGMALYFSYLSAIAVAACLLCWLADRGRSLVPSTAALFLISLAAGAAPLLCYTLYAGFAGLSVIGLNGAAPSAGSTASSLAVFLRMLLLDREWMNGRMPPALAQAFQLIYASGIVAGTAALFLACRGDLAQWGRRIFRGGRTRAAPLSPLVPVCLYLLLFPCFFVGAHIERRVRAELPMMAAYRYFALYYPFLIFALALAVSRLWERGTRVGRGTALAIGAFAVYSCLLPLSIEMLAGEPGLGLRSRGYSGFALGWNFAQKGKYWNDPGRGLEIAGRLSAPDRADYLRGFTEVRWWDAVEEPEGGQASSPSPAVREALHSVERTARRADPRFTPYFYVSLGRVLAFQYIFEKRHGVGTCLAMAGGMDPRYFGEIIRGIGQTVGSRDRWMRDALSIAACLPREHRAEYRRGIAEGRRLSYYHSVYEH